MVSERRFSLRPLRGRVAREAGRERGTPYPERAVPSPPLLAQGTLPRRGGRELARHILIVFLFLLPLPAHALEPGDLTLTVTPELSGNVQPYAREMVLLRLRGVYRTTILLEEMRQPPLTNFSWTQLGRDTWGRTQLPDGQMALQFERTVAIFPQHTGTFTIEPFVHRLTISENGERKIVEARSEPIVFPVEPWKADTGGPDAAEPWWLPARDVTVTDSWEPDPETITTGETTRRIVTLVAQGLLAEGLPPRPILRTRGILTFAGPTKRETIITPGGPVAKATYQWDIKAGVREVIPLNAIKIPWFDTATRTMREAEIPARQIGGGLAARESDLKPTAPASWRMILLSGFAAFGIGLALIGFGTRQERLRLDGAARRALRRAAATGDVTGFRAVLTNAMQTQPKLAAAWSRDASAQAGLAALDVQVFGCDATGKDRAQAPDLAALAPLFGRPRRCEPDPLADLPKLVALDGPRGAIAARN